MPDEQEPAITPENKPLPEAFVSAQWKPGQSGNPSGRPKKKPITEAYEKLLEDPANAAEVAQALLDVIKARSKGTVHAAKEMADRVEGPVTNKLELSGEVSLADRLAKARKNAAGLRSGSGAGE
jgi:hypothetical protein